MKRFFGYIRVSTAKQGQQGVSLQEQRDAILRHAGKNNLEIVSWFEEQETAAKRGRPVFTRMLKLLRQEKAHGVILHKIDRGARNLKDWADMADLIDAGIDVHFANENLDMHSRGGRLSADIQAVVAADYIRNLRDETKKGFYGRLKQGIYPLGAPLGYLNCGGGKPKEPDPRTAPLVRKAFEMYASCRYTLDQLSDELYRLGLRNRADARLTRGGLAKLLKNPFYFGLIRLRTTRETFSGVHRPLIPKSLYDRVQKVLSGKANTAVQKHDFVFRRLLKCRQCGNTLIGERQKGNHYYRCHTPDCPTTGVREEVVDAQVRSWLSRLQFTNDERAYFRAKLSQMAANNSDYRESEIAAATLRLGQLKDRLNRLTDAFLDGTIDRSLFEQRKVALLNDQKSGEENMANLRDPSRQPTDRLSEFLELADRAWLSYEMGLPEEKRDLLKIVTSNRALDGKYVVIELSLPFLEVAKRLDVSSGGPKRAIPRTWDRLLATLAKLNKAEQLPELERPSDCEENDISVKNPKKRGWFAGGGNISGS